LLNNSNIFTNSGFSTLWGISRKSIIGQITGKIDPKDRLYGTLASSAYAFSNQIDILRVHDVDEHNDFFKVLIALNNSNSTD
jgi:dihydropteroate synthase